MYICAHACEVWTFSVGGTRMVGFSYSMKALVAWRGGLFLTERKIGVLSVSSLFVTRVGSTALVNACILSAKMHMDSSMRAYATVQKLLCCGSYRELITSLARTSYRLSFAARPPAGSTKSVARRCLLRKSVQIHASS